MYFFSPSPPVTPIPPALLRLLLYSVLVPRSSEIRRDRVAVGVGPGSRLRTLSPRESRGAREIPRAPSARPARPPTRDFFLYRAARAAPPCPRAALFPPCPRWQSHRPWPPHPRIARGPGPRAPSFNSRPQTRSAANDLRVKCNLPYAMLTLLCAMPVWRVRARCD